MTNEMDRDALLRIAEACTNVMLDFDQRNRSFTETVIALGRAASSWKMAYADQDSSVFRRVGLSCPNLKRISVKTAWEGFSATTFGGLFSFPKHQLRALDVGSIAFNVVAEKHDSLTSLSCTGYSISIEALRLLFQSQKNLIRIHIHYERQCSCRDDGDRPDQRHVNDMGTDWRPIGNAFIDQSNVTEIQCTCSEASRYESKRCCPDFSAAIPWARGRDLSIVICYAKVH